MTPMCRKFWLIIFFYVPTLTRGVLLQTAVKRGEPVQLSVARLTKENGRRIGLNEAKMLPGRTLAFTKKLSASSMKVTYVDNFRVYGTETFCRWTIKIDGKDCAVPVYNTKGTASTSDYDCAPHAIAGTCDGIPQGDHTMTIALTRNAGADCQTGWTADDAGRDAFFMEAEELNPSGQITSVMRKLGYIGSAGGYSGFLKDRALDFNKRTDASRLRITWATNLRVDALDDKGDGRCDWEVRIDGKSCQKPTKIGVSMHSQGDDNDHIPVEVVGWCENIRKGPHRISIYTSSSNNAGCKTGWGSNDYMEVWEPTPQEQALIAYAQAVGTDNDADESASVVSAQFTKQSPASSVRILYYDNLRVIARGTEGEWCRWEVKVDGKSCPAPLAGSVYTKPGDNDLYPASIVGQCPGLAKGEHRIDIALTRKSNRADCHTGWTPRPRVMHVLIEVRETPAVETTTPHHQCVHVPTTNGLRGTKPLASCRDAVCGGESHCVDRPDGFECFCAKGWIGGGHNACCENVNECLGLKCGGAESKCVDGINLFECLCAEGYSGGGVNAVCTANKCLCANGVGATASACPVNGAAKCVSCDRGFDLQMDDTCVDSCAEQHCGGHGNCYAGKCYCKDGYTGRTCDDAPDPCAKTHCGPHGRCFGGDCFCEDFYTGKNCQIPPRGSGSGNVVVVHGRQ